MGGGFSVPSFMPSSILRGVTDRLHEHEKMEFEDAQARRREILDFYGKAMDNLAPEPQFDQHRAQLMSEMADVSAMDPEKVRKYKVKGQFVVPPHLAEVHPEPAKVDLSHVQNILSQLHAHAAGQQAAGGQPQTSFGPGAGVTPQGMADQGPGPSGPSMASMPPAPPQTATMPFEAGQGPMAGGGLTPAATPPGRSAPEASPMTPGITPGQPSAQGPTMGGAPMAPPQPMASAPPPMAPMAPAPQASAGVTPDLSPFPHKLSPRYGAARGASAAAELAPKLEAAAAHGVTLQGKPLITAHDVAYAAKAGYVIERDPTSGQFVQRAARPEELSAQQSQQLEINQLKSIYTQHRQQLVDAQTELAATNTKLKPAELKLKQDALGVQWARVAAEQQNLALKLRTFEAGIVHDPTTGQVMNPRVAALLMPPSLSRSRADLARASQQKVNEVIELVKQAADEVGPFSGTVNELLLKHGLSNSEVATLDMAMDNVAAMQPGVHGIRSAQMADRFKQKLTLNQPAENLIGMLGELQTTADAVIGVGGLTTPLIPVDNPHAQDRKPSATPGITPSSTRMSREETNKRTGAKRTTYSDDGGKTWHP